MRPRKPLWRLILRVVACAGLALVATSGCSGGEGSAGEPLDSSVAALDVDAASGEDRPSSVDGEPADDAGAEEADSAAGGADGVDDSASSPTDPYASRRLAFRLFYSERLERTVLSLNRFGIFGDSGAATEIGRKLIARTGEDYEVVVGPTDNNLIGTTTFGIYQAWRVFRSRSLELTLRRLFRGLLFYEAVTGHPGLTSRMVLPGWTRVMDGVSGTVTRTRLGVEVSSPDPTPALLEQAVLEAFYDGVRVTYRENPQDTLLTFAPGHDPEGFAITHSIPDLPRFIRVSDCCATAFKVPEGKTWAGAWWSNHNSRDNFPDIALGILAAMECAADPEAPEDLRALADDVVKAGRRIADAIEASGGNIMTVDEHNDYETLVVSGTVRPHGLVESEDLGSMASCPMALLNRALSSTGLVLEPEGVQLPGALEGRIPDNLQNAVDCDVPLPRTCAGLHDAYCGLSWSEFESFRLFNQPILDLARTLEESKPGAAEELLGAFQNDFDDVAEAMLAIIHYSRVTRKDDLFEEARRNLAALTGLMRSFAEVIWGDREPEQTASQRYDAALFDAVGGLAVIVEDLKELAPEERAVARAESLLDLPETTPAPLLSDEELRERVMDGLANLQDRSGPGRSDAIRQRYDDHYGDEIPIRRAGDAYEARQGDGPWYPADRPRHRAAGHFDFLQAVSICSLNPEVLDCAWARLGCAPADLDADGRSDAADREIFEQRFEAGRTCSEGDGWCEGVDLDRSGALDEEDRAFLDAAEGCVR